VRIVVADDSVLLRQGVCAVLRDAGLDVVGEAGDVTGLLREVGAKQPDVAVVDIRMPPDFALEGIEAERQIRASRPGTGVLLLSQYLEVHYAVELMTGAPGGVGYLLKDRVGHPGELVDAVRRVGAGEFVVDRSIVSLLMRRQRQRDPVDELTHRERDVLKLMAEGRSNAAIASQLYLSAKTIETHVNAIFTKLGLTATPDDNRRVLAVLRYLRA
jgi:DNA-binding NarL/FixJ family response regulator